MNDLHNSSVEFFYNLLKEQQLRQAEEATTRRKKILRNAFTQVQNRLLLELHYGQQTDGAN